MFETKEDIESYIEEIEEKVREEAERRGSSRRAIGAILKADVTAYCRAHKKKVKERQSIVRFEYNQVLISRSELIKKLVNLYSN